MRAKLPQGQFKKVRTLRMSDEDWEKIRAYCQREGLDFQEWARVILKGAARKGFRTL